MENVTLKTVITSSLERLIPESAPRALSTEGLSCLSNEPFSFQIAYRLASDRPTADTVHVRIESELPISLFSVGYVPVLQAGEVGLDDTFRPGLMGDPLYRKRVNPKILKKYSDPKTYDVIEDDPTHLHARSESWMGIWITVNENGRRLGGGVYPIRAVFYSSKGKELGDASLSLRVIPASLPKQKLKYTNWLHSDCLADVYGIEPFCERFWEIFASFVREGVRHGANMLLTPCFTPALDTPIGEERRTVQLVGVTLRGGEYSFDFHLLDRYLEIARSEGVEYFEHSHFFTQWGAAHAPKVMATVNGKYKRIFGWDTVSWGKKYTAFLSAYIPALLSHLKEKGLDRLFMFHVSDEPEEKNLATYRRARAVLGKLLDGYPVGDALSSYKYYADGTVTTPIAITDHAGEFYGRTEHLWTYYTGGQCKGGFSNRKLNCSGERNRMLGVQMYMHGIEGFLHWGYNFWYDRLSSGVSDPRADACFYLGANPATSYSVYPALNGTCIPSTRQKVFYEGICDLRALLCLERRIGKKKTRELVESFFGSVTFATHPGSAERLLAFRQVLNEKIASLL